MNIKSNTQRVAFLFSRHDIFSCICLFFNLFSNFCLFNNSGSLFSRHFSRKLPRKRQTAKESQKINAQKLTSKRALMLRESQWFHCWLLVWRVKCERDPTEQHGLSCLLACGERTTVSCCGAGVRPRQTKQ